MGFKRPRVRISTLGPRPKIVRSSVFFFLELYHLQPLANTIKNRFVVFVEFDDDYVLEDTDNYAVAIAITKEDIRYFTYEKITDEEGKENQIVGEIVFSADGNNEHKKYGNTPEYNISYFAGVIDNIL